LQRRGHRFNSQVKQELKCKCVFEMQCKLLWIKASTKCINVNGLDDGRMDRLMARCDQLDGWISIYL